MAIRILLVLLLFFACTSLSYAQNSGHKKNQRPVSALPVNSAVLPAGPPVYFYTFENPKFILSNIRIEHDENGIGRIIFRKKDFEDEFSNELRLSATSVAIIKSYWGNLDFLNSDAAYQSNRDFSHLGTMGLRMVRDKKERQAEFNWTENSDIKALTDEYKKIGYQYVWIFDMEVAMRNQPLETPRIMKRIDSYLRRGEISDPSELLPYLRKLGNDERLPLIARNHAIRLADSIEVKLAKK